MIGHLPMEDEIPATLGVPELAVAIADEAESQKFIHEHWSAARVLPRLNEPENRPGDLLDGLEGAQTTPKPQSERNGDDHGTICRTISVVSTRRIQLPSTSTSRYAC